MRHSSALLLTLAISTAPVSAAGAAATDHALEAMQQGDFKTALDELRPLAAKNDPNAQFLLGMLYDAGRGVPQDQAAAATWYRKAAKQHHLMAQLYLGILCYSGEGVKQNFAEAARWLRAPADSGDDQAQFYLGSMYANGQGVAKNDSLAILWLSKAAAQKNTRAMGMLASELFSRSRDEQDRIDAYVWSHLAAELDPVQAMTSARAVTERYCTDDQKKQAKKSMSDWKRRWSDDAKASGR